MKIQGLTRVSLVLVMIGAINLGLVGVLQFDLVAMLLGGADSLLTRLMNTIFGLAGLQLIGPFLRK